jgi:acetylornithine deacetylase/succinyl-diaminopimelate desuccinylase-like protein
MTVLKPSDAMLERILDLAVSIQQVPAPTFEEMQRAQFVQTHFQDAGLTDVRLDATGNLFAKRPGGDGKAMLVSAHLDTVFDAETDLTITRTDERIAGPGIGDNSLAVAALIGLAWALDENNVQLPGDLWIVANVGEEGLGDLKGMREVMAQLKDTVSATIVLEGMMLGTVVHEGIGSRRYRISVKAPGGHSWGNFGETSAIHTLVNLSQQLTQLQVPDEPKTTFNIGVIEGGTSVNTIAESASLLLDLRSAEATSLENLVQQVEMILENFESDDAEVIAEVIGDRPSGSIDASHPLVELADETLESVGVELDHWASSTDANIPLAMNHPAVCIGLTTGKNAHRLSEYVEVQPFHQGFEQLLQLTVGVSELIQSW